MDWGADDDPVLEGRLENWGRWAGDGCARRGTSPLYRLIEEGMTKEEAEQRARERHVIVIDEKDAKIINDAVLSTPYETLRDRQDRKLFIALYTAPNTPISRILRTNHVSEREFVRSVKRIRHIVQNYLNRIEERDRIGADN